MTVLRVVCLNCKAGNNMWFFDDSKYEDHERYKKFAEEHNEMHKDAPKPYHYRVTSMRSKHESAAA